MVEQHFVRVLKLATVDVLFQVIRLAQICFISPFNLLIQGLDARRQKAVQMQVGAFVVAECSSLIQGRVAISRTRTAFLVTFIPLLAIVLILLCTRSVSCAIRGV